MRLTIFQAVKEEIGSSSLIIAHFLKLPHLTIYKDLKIVVSNETSVEEPVDLKGKKVLHIADLITEASSYDRAWIPAVANSGGI
jgi:hypothetical protein